MNHIPVFPTPALRLCFKKVSRYGSFMTNVCHQISGPNIISQIIEGEVIILNLDKGHYYSLRDFAAQIWHGILIENQSTDKLIDDFIKRYDADENTIRVAVEKTLAELKQENLIIESSEALGNCCGLPAAVSEKAKFVAPVVEKYTDMQELLLLDPIHEVDALVGWPKKKD